ncbi:MAG: hypothetical protein M1835_003299 [Candelina submexicana]|nr:MAG: hypothetical protein M1835_003299 [Candelina submexicana]
MSSPSGPVAGLDPGVANTLREYCSTWVRQNRREYTRQVYTEPFYRLFLMETKEVQGALDDFFARGDIVSYAQQLRIPVDQVHRGLVVNAWISIYVKMQQELRVPPTTRPFHLISHLALGDLSYENGLPAIGNPPLTFNLTSGQVLHTDAEVSQLYSGRTGQEGAVQNEADQEAADQKVGYELTMVSKRP